MKKRFRTWLTSFLAGISALSLVGGTIFTFTDKTVNAATETQVIKPYIEYTFDNAQDFYGNTGASASDTTKDYTLKKASATADIQRNGYVEFAKNDMLYLPMGKNNSKNPFANGELQNFTFAFDVNATFDNADGAWFRTLFALDSFTAYGENTELEKYCRIESKAFYGTEWFRSGLKGLTPNKEQYKTYSEGEIVYGYVAGTTTGSLTIVFSYEAGNTLTIKTYKDKQEVGAVSLELNGWTVYNETSAYKTFTIGGCYDTRYIESIDGSNHVTLKGFAGKFVGAMDNIRIYNFAMTETQMGEYAANKQLTKEVEIPEPTYKAEINPYIEWNFDDATKFYANTGTSASDTTKDYTLQKWGGEIAAPGYVSFSENAVLYPTENPFLDNEDLTDFTLVMDVNAGVAGYYGSLFSFDSFSKSGNNHEKITRMDVRQPSSTAGRWLGWGDSKVHTISDSWSSWKKTVYQASSALQNNTTVTTGNITVVFSVDSDSSINVRVYKDGVKVSDDGEVSTVSLPAGWSLYNENSTYKKFTLGAAHDARYFNYETGTLTNLARSMKGTMDNIRIYDFAMTENQMAEYGANKKLETSGIQIQESENGSVSVENYTPAIGEKVVINTWPNVGYEVDKVFVNGVQVEAVDGVYSTTMIYDGLYIEVTYKETLESKFNVISMASGAAVRYGGQAANSGLRFQMLATKAEYETLMQDLPNGVTAEYGILVIPADYQKTYGAFTVENLFGASAKYHLAEKNEDGSLKAYNGSLPQIMNFWTSELFLNEKTGNYEYFGSITGIKAANLTRKFVGVGVIKYTVNAETKYTLVKHANNDIANSTRSIYQVAKLAVQDEKLNPTAKLWLQTNYIDVVENAVTALSGKKLSILGDSISTFKGVSNDTNANETIGKNEVFYTTQMAMDDTWWKQAADATGMSILVNNAWAGSNVATNFGNEKKGGCTARAENLHDVNGVTPDIIAVYMGINDCGCLTELGEFNSVADIWDGTKYVGNTEKFATAYATMVHKLISKYGVKKVFLFTLPRNGYLWKGTKDEYNALQDEYNKMIYKIAEVFGCQVVDLATSVGEDYSEYLLGDKIHPNAKGMDLITAAFETALYSYYYEKLN